MKTVLSVKSLCFGKCWIALIYAGLIALLTNLSSVSLAASPLSGIILVGGALSHFDDLPQVFAAIEANGTSGDLEVLVSPGTYNGPIEINNFNGIHQIWIRGNPAGQRAVLVNDAVSGTADNFILKIHNSKNVIVDGFEFASIVSNFGNALHISGSSETIQVRNSVFQGQSTLSGNHTAIHIAPGTHPSPQKIKIENCEFNGGGSHLTVPTGSYDTNMHSKEITVRNNHMRNCMTSISLAQVQTVVITGNSFEDVNSAITLTHTRGRHEIANNRISAYVSGVSVTGCDFSTTSPGIYNNIISVNGFYIYSGNSYTSAATALHVGSSGISIYHNSLFNSSDNWQSSALAVTGNSNRIINNSIVNWGSGSVAFITQTLHQDQPTSNIFRHNNVYSRSRHLVRVMNTYYKTIEEIFAEFFPYSPSYNLTIYPVFVDEGDQLTESLLLDNRGTVLVGYEMDFYGQPRDPSTPDIGAIEFSGNPALSAMSGQYWIGNSPTHDFSSLTEAVDNLIARGINGSTRIVLDGDDHPEQVNLEFVHGVTDSRVLYFDGSEMYQNRIIASGTAAQPYLFRIGRVHAVTFRNLGFHNLSETHGNALLLDSVIESVTVENCHFSQQSIRSSGAKNDNLFISANAAVKTLNVSDSVFHGGRSGIRSSNSIDADYRIEQCSFTMSRNPIWLDSTKTAAVNKNEFEHFDTTAIYINQSSAVDILKNHIFGMGTGRGIHLITKNNQTWTLGQPYPHLIANNIIGVIQSGIEVAGEYVDVLHNNIDAVSLSAKGFVQSNQSANLNLIGNAIRSEGLVIGISAPAANQQNVNYQGNAYLGTSFRFVAIGSTEYLRLFEWRAASPDLNEFSIEADPLFDANLYTTSPLMYNRAFGTNRVQDDIDDQARDVFHDIGANEHQTPAPVFVQAEDGYLTVGEGMEYATLQDCFDDLARFGWMPIGDDNRHLSPVFILLAPGTHSMQAELKHIPRDWETIEETTDSWIVLRPAIANSEVILTFPETPSGNDPILRMNGVERVLLSGIRFEHPGNHGAASIDFYGRGQDVHIINSEFHEDPNGAFVGFRSSILLQNIHSQRFVFKHNQFENGNHAIYVKRGYIDFTQFPSHQNIEIGSNSFSSTAMPVYLEGVIGAKIEGNQFLNFKTGLQARSCSDQVAVRLNSFISSQQGGHNLVGADFSSIKTGPSGLALELESNVFSLTGDNGYNTVHGLVLAYSDKPLVANNNIAVTFPGTSGSYYKSYAISFGFSNNQMRIVDNIISAHGNARVLSMPQWIVSETSVFSHNCFYAEGIVFAQAQNTFTTFDEFAATYPELCGHSFVAYPFLDDNHYSTSPFLVGKGSGLGQFKVGHDWQSIIAPYPIGATQIDLPSATPRSGVFRIGPSMEYPSLRLALEDLMKNGINGDVELRMRRGLLSNQNHVVRSIPAQEEAFGVRLTCFPYEDKTTLRFSASSAEDNFILKFVGVRNFHLSSLIFDNQGTEYSTPIQFFGLNQNVRFTDTVFTGLERSSLLTSDPHVLIDARGSKIEQLHIEDSQFLRGSFALINTYTDTIGELTVENCVFENSYCGIQAHNLNRFVFDQNQMQSIKDTVLDLNFIHQSYRISNNQIRYLNGIGIQINQSTPIEQNYVFNNLIHRAAAFQNHNLVRLGSAGSVSFAHNTLVNQSTGSAGVFISDSAVTQIDFVNNILSSTSSGPAANFSSTANVLRAHNNLFHKADGQNVIRWGTETFNQHSQLAGVAKLHHSMITVSRLDLDTLLPLPTSPAIDAGIILGYAMSDALGRPRVGLPDLGAFETGTLPEGNPPARWLLTYFNSLDDPRAQPQADADGDGWSNYREYIAGLDPLDPNSRFHVLITKHESEPDAMILHLSPILADRDYFIEQSEDLIEWTVVDAPELLFQNNTSTRKIDTQGVAAGFYRIGIQLH